MRIITTVLVICTAVAVLAAGYGFIAAAAIVSPGVGEAIPAINVPERFDALKDSLKKGLPAAISLINVQKTASGAPIMELFGAEEYYFLELPLRIINANFLKMEWLDARVIPMNGDIMQLNAPSVDIEPFSTCDITVTLLTKNPASERGVHVEYYVLGRKIQRAITAN